MKNWGMFWGLGMIWGSSFLLIKVGVEQLGALPLVSVRIGLAAVFMALFLLITRRKLPTDRREIAALLFVGVMNTTVPFSLITWGEQTIDSGLATVLNATTPLFTLVIAHFALADERITPQKIAGLVVGFLGVALLASRSSGSGGTNPLSGQLAVLLASASYATSIVAIRRYLRKVEPLTTAGVSLIVGGITIVLVTLLTVHPLPDVGSLTTKTIAAVVTLALLNTTIAYFLYYHLIGDWGATRTSVVTYVMPPIGVTLGAILLDEAVDWKIVAGALLILAGIIATNWHKRKSPVPAPQVAVEQSGGCAD